MDVVSHLFLLISARGFSFLSCSKEPLLPCPSKWVDGFFWLSQTRFSSLSASLFFFFRAFPGLVFSASVAPVFSGTSGALSGWTCPPALPRPFFLARSFGIPQKCEAVPSPFPPTFFPPPGRIGLPLRSPLELEERPQRSHRPLSCAACFLPRPHPLSSRPTFSSLIHEKVFSPAEASSQALLGPAPLIAIFFSEPFRTFGQPPFSDSVPVFPFSVFPTSRVPSPSTQFYFFLSSERQRSSETSGSVASSLSPRPIRTWKIFSTGATPLFKMPRPCFFLSPPRSFLLVGVPDASTPLKGKGLFFWSPATLFFEEKADCPLGLPAFFRPSPPPFSLPRVRTFPPFSFPFQLGPQPGQPFSTPGIKFRGHLSKACFPFFLPPPSCTEADPFFPFFFLWISSLLPVMKSSHSGGFFPPLSPLPFLDAWDSKCYLPPGPRRFLSP